MNSKCNNIKLKNRCGSLLCWLDHLWGLFSVGENNPHFHYLTIIRERSIRCRDFGRHTYTLKLFSWIWELCRVRTASRAFFSLRKSTHPQSCSLFNYLMKIKGYPLLFFFDHDYHCELRSTTESRPRFNTSLGRFLSTNKWPTQFPVLIIAIHMHKRGSGTPHA